MKKETVIPIDSEDHKCLLRGGVLEVTITPSNRKVSLILQNIDHYDLYDAVHCAINEKENVYRGHKKVVGACRNIIDFLTRGK